MTATLGEIAAEINAELHGDPDCKITNVASLPRAGAGQLSFCANKHYYSYLSQTEAAAVVLRADDAARCKTSRLVAADPYLAYAKAARMLNPQANFQPGVHPTAVIEPDARIAPGCFIGAQVYIGAQARIGACSWIGPGCVIEARARLGSHCRLLANVTVLQDVSIGRRALLHPGVVIGSDGYGMANDGGRWLKIPQLGSVRVGDDVELGANTTIDRGTLDDTVIEAGVKIDNQVHIGHNAHVGEHTAIAGAAALAGSVKLGKRCMIGGACAIAGHVELADDVTITGMSGVAGSIGQAGVYSGGIPVTENRIWRKNIARFRHLDELVRKFARLAGNVRQ